MKTRRKTAFVVAIGMLSLSPSGSGSEIRPTRAFDAVGAMRHAVSGPPSVSRLLPAANGQPPAASYSQSPPSNAEASVIVFGPLRYGRTRGRPGVHTATINVPSWVVGPHTLRVENGEPDHAPHIHHGDTHRDHARYHDDDDERDRKDDDEDGTSRDHPHTHHYRVRSAVIEINDKRVADPHDFRQHTPGFEKQVVLTPKTALRLVVRGKPDSYITITLLGKRGDNTPPQVTVASPVPASIIGTPTPHVAIDYQDTVGAGEQAASGLIVASLRVSIDGIDRTDVLTAGPSEATAALADPLAEGVHTLEASITDVAGNVGRAVAAFTVDLTAPAIGVVEPTAGAFLAVATPTIRVTYQDAIGVDPASFRATVNGVDRTARFSADAGTAVGTLDAESALAEGANDIVVSVSDRAGHVATATARVTADLTAPRIVIVQPRDQQYTAATVVDVSGGVVDASSVTVRVNGVDALLSGSEFVAANVPIGDGAVVPLRVVATDAAGNTGESVVTVQVDRTAPTVEISSPTASAYVKGPLVSITGMVNDETPVTVEINGEYATLDVACAARPAACTFSSVVSAPDGALAIRVVARDAAGNQATAEVGVTLDSAAPVLAISEPVNGFTTGASAVRVAGTVGDATPATVRVNGVETSSAGGSFSSDVPAAEGPVVIAVAAVDVAGNEATVEIAGVVDRTPPELEVITPPAGGVVGTDPVSVQGVVRDATDTIVTVDGAEATRSEAVWHAEPSGVADGSHTFIIVATDAAGNRTTTQLTTTIDHSPPVVTIDTPAAGALTRESATVVSGTVVDSSLVSVTVNGVPATLGGSETPLGAGFGPSRTFGASGVPLAEGDNHIVVVATDATGRAGQAEIDLTRDSTPPTIELDAPASITHRRHGTLAAMAADNVALASVELTVNGMPLQTFTAPPFQAPLAPPGGAVAGSTLVVMATATDRAGNVSTATASVRVAADGVVVGQTLDDATGLPLAGATVVLTALGAVSAAPSDGRASGTGIPGIETISDDRGGYSLASADPTVIVAATKRGMTTVEREVTVQPEVGTVAIDARLTALAAPITIGSTGGALHARIGSAGNPNTSGPVDTGTGEIVVTIPSGTLTADIAFSLMPLSAQGLPNLLPLGWSQLAAFDLRSIDGTQPAYGVGGPMSLEIILPTTDCQRPVSLPTASCPLPATVHLVRYDFDIHHWLMVTPDVAVTNGAITSDLSVFGAYALVVPDVDDDGVPLPQVNCQTPAAGCQLTGVEMVPLPITATSDGNVSPSAVPPAGGPAEGVLTVTSPVTLTSGTVVQASVTETFTLASGDVASEETRTQDLVLYRVKDVGAGTISTSLSAVFPITPSRRFGLTELIAGRVHLDVYAGREHVRGQSGGSEPVSVGSGGAVLTVPGGALPQDTAISLQPAVLSNFLPSTATLQPLAEYVIDLSDRTLASSAVLSLSLSELPAACCESPATLLLARVVRPTAVPRLQVVALLMVEADRAVTHAVAGLPGVVAGGRYVVYRATEPVGFVAGTTRTSAGPVGALVETTSLPFVAIAGGDGAYIVAARSATVDVSARVVGTSLAARGSADVPPVIDALLLGDVAQAFRPASLDLLLQPAASIAVVTPANGAVAIPTTTQIELGAERPLDPAALAAARIRLVYVGAASQSGPPTPAPVPELVHPIRLVLSGSGRTLALVPLERLSAGAIYRVEASGLVDVLGGLVLVQPAQFTTRVVETPVYNIDKLAFGFPDATGMVHFTGPALTLPPGTRVLVVNATTGEVASFAAGNDGAIDGMLAASLRDRLLVTITDPLGRVMTFERGEYVAPDGRTAVNRGGGTVEGTGGAEVRIPQEALVEPLVISVKTIGLDELPPGPLPDLPDAQIGAAVQIDVTAADPNTTDQVDLGQPFQKPIDLAFQKPAEAPPDATFRVLRRMVGPDGRVVYESIDYADVEGEGEQAKVTTLSYPFSGYASNVNSYSLSGIDATGAIGNQFTNHALLAWAYDSAAPGRAIGGAISGKVLRVKFAPGAAAPEFEPVPRAIVSGVDAAGQPLFALRPEETANTPTNIAVSQSDGTFALFDPRYTGGPITVSATVDGVTRTATAYESNPQDTKSPGLRFARHTATANITFPAVAPAAPPAQIEIRVTTEAQNRRTLTNGVVIAGTPLVIGLRAHDAEVKGVQIGGTGLRPTEHALRIDPLRGIDPLALDVIVEPDFIAPQPGVYTVTAIATRSDGSPVSATTIFRAVGPGGSGNDPLPNDPPAVITARTVPKANAVGVAATVLPQIVFSEPVKQIPGNVTLVEADSNAVVAFTLLGAGPNGAVDAFTADTVATSLTLQPMTGLKYATRYTLRLASGIVDLDDGGNNTAANKPLVPYEASFTTFSPQPVGATEETFTTGGLVIVGDRAYVAQNVGRSTTLRVYDVSDPVVPAEIVGMETGGSTQLGQPPPVSLAGNPVDLAVEEDSPVTGGRLLVVATNPLTYPYHPANVRLYDVTDDGVWQWRGVVTLGGDPVDGLIRRIVLRGELLYAVTAGVGKGIQVVDLASARELFEIAAADGDNSIAFWDMVRASSTEGVGFGQMAVVQTIPVDTGTGLNSQLAALGVMDLPVDGVTQPIVVATGRSPLIVANPQTGDVLYNGAIKADSADTQSPALTSWGFAIAAGMLQGRPIAAVSTVGATGAPHTLAIVDLTDPRAPTALGTIELPGFATSVDDLVLRDTTLYVGSETGTVIVSLADPMQPRVIGTLSDAGGRLAFLDDKLVFGSARIPTETQHPLGGVRSAALGGPLVIIPAIRPQLTRGVAATATGRDVNAAIQEEFVSQVPVTARVIGGAASTGVLSVLQDGVEIGRQALSYAGAAAAALIARGTRILKDAVITVVATADTVDGVVQSAPRRIPAGAVTLMLDSNNDTLVDEQDIAARAEGKQWAFWQAARNSAGLLYANEFDLEDFATVRVRLAVPAKELRLRIGGVDPARNAQLRWGLARKSGLDLKYLSDEKTAKTQVALLNRGCDGRVAGLVVPGPGGCHQLGAAGLVLEQVPQGTLDLVFRCTECAEDPSRRIIVETRDPDLGWVELTGERVDIRPLTKWMSVFSAHGEPGQASPTASLKSVDSWSPVPSDVDRLTVLVHGFHTSESDAITFTFPKMMKRLYWAAHPVLEPQAGHTVGIAWPGDNGFPDLLYFPTDEFNAFLTGIPVARKLDELKSSPSRYLNILAHSLGSLVVNNALLRTRQLSQQDTLVMLEATVPAESFDPQYSEEEHQERDTLETERQVLVVRPGRAANNGYPDDQKWANQWQLMQNIPLDLERCTIVLECTPTLADLWKERIDKAFPENSPQDYRVRYVQRWTQAPFGNSPWRGLFASNAAKITIFNMYNASDEILTLPLRVTPFNAWAFTQIFQKPALALFGFAGGDDDERTQFWAALGGDDSDLDTFEDPTDVLNAGETPKSLVRRWRELSFYFQPISGPSGSRALTPPSAWKGRNIDVKGLVPSAGSESHTYPGSGPIWQAFAAYERAREAFDR